MTYLPNLGYSNSNYAGASGSTKDFVSDELFEWIRDASDVEPGWKVAVIIILLRSQLPLATFF